jgi:hypothetical protein
MKLRAWLSVTALIGVGAFVIWTAFRVINAPSTEEAMRRSLRALEKPELEIAFALHPDVCSIKKVSIWKWSVACEDVPMHFYQNITVCDAGRPQICGPAPSSYENCASFYWDVDLDGNPSDPLGIRRKYSSIGAEKCRPKGTIASERTEMVRRGLLPNPVKILDLTGKPRPIHR